jgi:hypothetical protein
MSIAYTAFAFLIPPHTHPSHSRGSKSTRTHLTRALWNASARLLKNIDFFGYRTNKTRLRALSCPLKRSHLIWRALSLVAPTGIDDPPERKQIGPETFYYYGPGGGGVDYVD